MKIFKACLLLFLGIIILGCSNDNCSQSDWVGTFVKINENCDNGGTPLFEDSVTYTAGTCTNCVSDGSTTKYEFDENCVITHTTPLFGELILTLDGTTIHVSAPLINCSATYEKQ